MPQMLVKISPLFPTLTRTVFVWKFNCVNGVVNDRILTDACLLTEPNGNANEPAQEPPAYQK